MFEKNKQASKRNGERKQQQQQHDSIRTIATALTLLQSKRKRRFLVSCKRCDSQPSTEEEGDSKRCISLSARY